MVHLKKNNSQLTNNAIIACSPNLIPMLCLMPMISNKLSTPASVSLSSPMILSSTLWDICLGYHILIIEAQQIYLVISIKLIGLFYVYVYVCVCIECVYVLLYYNARVLCLYIYNLRHNFHKWNEFRAVSIFCILIVFIYHFVCRFVFMYYI